MRSRARKATGPVLLPVPLLVLLLVLLLVPLLVLLLALLIVPLLALLLALLLVPLLALLLGILLVPLLALLLALLIVPLLALLLALLLVPLLALLLALLPVPLVLPYATQETCTRSEDYPKADPLRRHGIQTQTHTGTLCCGVQHSQGGAQMENATQGWAEGSLQTSGYDFTILKGNDIVSWQLAVGSWQTLTRRSNRRRSHRCDHTR